MNWLKISGMALLATTCVAANGNPASRQPRLSDQDISEAYIYLLGRLHVTRQQQLDFRDGFQWNTLVHRQPGAVDWPNPNLDVAYSEAWLAVDESSCTIISVPKIQDRYFTVQLLNGWGETLANINERVFPKHPYGDFAVCLRGADVKLPNGITSRIDLPVRQARLLSRVALGNDQDGAVALQHGFRLTATGAPKTADIPKTPVFELEQLPGVEAFDAAAAALDSEPDTNAGLEQIQQTARSVAEAIKEPAERARVDQVIRAVAFPQFAQAGAIIGHGTTKNGWARPGVVGEYGIDYLTRTLVNHGGIWANIKPEVLYYRGGNDATGAELDGDNVYTLTFPADALPTRFAKYFWSVIAVDSLRFRVLPNPDKRYLLNEQTKPERSADGSLTLYFAAEKPVDAPPGNWLPTPKGTIYRLTLRFYGPLDGVANGTYYPPPLFKVR
jgi:hypothetical protein